MTRKKFLQDLDRSQANPPAHITDVERYEDDGISFTYWYLCGNVRREVCLKLITTNVDDYPDGNQFMLFTDDLDVDTTITDTFAQVQAVIDCSSVATALREISGGLHQALTLGLAENPIDLDSGSQPAYDSEPDDFDAQDQSDDDANFGLDELLPRPAPHTWTRAEDRLGKDNAEAIRRDLVATKQAGFKIGVHGDLSKAGIVCVSIRITKLGISEEAMQAWGLSRGQYLVLLIRFQRGYKSLTQVMESPALIGPVEMRVGLSDTYKPKVDEAFAIFNEVEDVTKLSATTQSQRTESAGAKGSLMSLFIGRPISDLLRERFPKIVKFRNQFNLSWGGAERLFNDRQGALLSDLSRDLTAYHAAESTSSTRALPKVVTEDALSTCRALQASLPLVSMQFVLRHFVRCTEFCLVCHCKVEDTFEALKPYVCSNPLCLYQFLALGFGPAAEWEILSQPYVVDLLISLCYSQARASKIREFPCGINLRVPILPHFKNSLSLPVHYPPVPSTSTNTTSVSPEPVKAFKATLDIEQKILTPIVGSWTTGKQRPSKGDWLVLDPSVGQRQGVYHCRISDEQGPNYVLDSINLSVTTNILPVKTAQKELLNQPMFPVDCYIYDANFDELSDQYRLHAMILLLDNLPPVKGMRHQLLQQRGGHREANLNILRKLCPTSALDLLRWIIASNRSCIMQVDNVATGTEDEANVAPSEDRVSGMDDWMQFRFAQGAPDKEQRFVDCIKKKSCSAVYPTLFAWHGSPLHNWHSIIRQGLNFDEIVNGRSCGHGVYMSPFLNTSMGYTNRGQAAGWPNSELKISSVVSLQEIVNAPASFVCTNPHFVVAQKDWIQTRYLFVKTEMKHSIGSSAKLTYRQDPTYTVKGNSNESVAIPITAISKSRRPSDKPGASKNKKRKVADLDLMHAEDFDDGMSVTTEQDDRDLLVLRKEALNVCDGDDVVMTDADDVFEDVAHKSHNLTSPKVSKKRSLLRYKNLIKDQPKTDFVPGSLDMSGIRLLPPPQSASVTATRALMRAFEETVKVQKTTPLHDLGFYIDPDRMENMYQWIVELHSFDKTLLLAQDMKAAGVSSIVCEMLFTNDFPFAPPFVRVVKPRFLDPMMGGGGHITNGGAICMELLTSTGWSAVNSIESVLLQVRLAMTERDRPARLLSNSKGHQTTPYSINEAISAYKRFCERHGWKVPKGLDSLASNR